jgi:hypothetical protein
LAGYSADRPDFAYPWLGFRVVAGGDAAARLQAQNAKERAWKGDKTMMDVVYLTRQAPRVQSAAGYWVRLLDLDEKAQTATVSRGDDPTEIVLQKGTRSRGLLLRGVQEGTVELEVAWCEPIITEQP